MKKSPFTNSQVIGVLKQAEAGTPVPEICRMHSVSSVIFYKWRGKFGGMDASMVSRLKELEDEDRRQKKIYAEAQRCWQKNREAISMARDGRSRGQTTGLSIRHASETFVVS